MKVAALARALGGELLGDGDVEVTAVADPQHATAGTIVMVRDARVLVQAETSAAAALLVPSTLSSSRKPLIRTRNLRVTFARMIALLHPDSHPVPGVHPTAVIGQATRLGAECTIGPYVVIGDGSTVGARVVIGAGSAIGKQVSIGDDTIIHPHVSVYDRSVLGSRVILHSGAVIGSDGFGYATEDGRQIRIPQIGRVVLEDDVEIGANTTIDRATLGETRIGARTKIDNLVQIGHNVQIGPDAIIVATVGISGSATVGARTTLAGGVGVVDHRTIGEGATVLAWTMVTKDVPPGAVVSGIPVQPHREALRLQAALRQVPALLDRVAALEDLGPSSGDKGAQPPARPRPKRKGRAPA
jgi:UDP-3-O-[3-hydroxymyristoyl] glucosamine N-acyltransferase